MIEKKLTFLKGMNLLLVEDDLKVLENMDAILSIFFNRVFTATNGTDALSCFLNNQIDMVITDYVMPVMDGYELSKAIRERNNKIPILFTSNYTDSEMILKLIPLNLGGYIKKPVEYSSLIQSLLNMIKQLEENGLCKIMVSPGMTYNFITKDLCSNDETKILLSKSERVLLELLIKHHNMLVSNEIIEYTLSPQESKSTQSIKNIIYRLRKKVGKSYIINIQEGGYMLRKFEN